MRRSTNETKARALVLANRPVDTARSETALVIKPRIGHWSPSESPASRDLNINIIPELFA
jgi:hypothetical protein